MTLALNGTVPETRLPIYKLIEAQAQPQGVDTLLHQVVVKGQALVVLRQVSRAT